MELSHLDDILEAIHNRMPKFSEFTLKTFVQQTVDSSHEFVSTCYKEATKLNSGALEYVGYHILSPEERVRRELAWTSKKLKITLAQSDVQLVEYRIRHENEIRSAWLYTPYLFNGFLQIKGKRYALNLGICEKTFARVVDKSTDGVMIRSIRAPIPFSRKFRHRVISAVTGAMLCNEFVITAKLHLKKHGRRKRETTNFLYLAARLGFDRTIERFGFSRDEFSFVEQPDVRDEQYHYILAKNDVPGVVHDVYLKVRADVFETPIGRKLVSNIIYLLSGFGIQTPTDLHDPSGYMWRILLGKIIYPDASIAMAHSNADTHIASVDVFIDPISRKRYNDFGVPVNDIYDLLVYVFDNIDSIMVNTLSQDLYTKRVDVMDGLLILPYATAIYLKFYATNQRQSLREAEVKSLMKMRPWTLDTAWSSSQRGLVQNVSTGSQIFNGNWLSSFGIFKNRADGSAEQRFHPSMAVVESITAFSGRDVGRTGLINPHLEIAPNGGIYRPDYAADIEQLAQYLPRN